MWNILFGFLLGRNARNAGMPDSVKQRRYDAKRSRRMVTDSKGRRYEEETLRRPS